MKKNLLAFILLTSLLSSPLLHAEQVGAAAAEGATQSSESAWKNIALAAGAIAVATIAILVVSRHEGHRAH
jgi:hypothetical protein